jgi:hypothetical protein
MARVGKRRGGRKNAARLAKAAGARELARPARPAEVDVLAELPDYAALYVAPAAPAMPAPLPFEEQARELVAYLQTMVERHGGAWLTEEEICDELIQAAGECECADETAILDGAVPALKELIDASQEHPMGLLTAVSVARRTLSRLAAQEH